MSRPAGVGDVMTGESAPHTPPQATAMSASDWILGSFVVLAYLACLFFVGVRTFQRGHLVLGILGCLLPLFWLIGAFLPDRNARRAGAEPTGFA
jgi:hypothetical protein